MFRFRTRNIAETLSVVHFLQTVGSLVIFYSFGYLPYWQASVGTPLQPVLAGEMYVQQTSERIYAVIKHPAATGVTSAYFHEAGQSIRYALTAAVPKNCV